MCQRIDGIGSALPCHPEDRTLGGRHLAIIVLGPLLPANEVLRRLIGEFDRDPLFGTVQPRFADVANEHIWPLPGHREIDPLYPTLTRAGLSILPTSVITAELVAACTVVRREVVARWKWTKPVMVLPQGDVTIAEVRLLLCQARRRGYRNLKSNQSCTVKTGTLSYPLRSPLLPYTAEG